ncbi:histone-lysine N-methyltransferase SETMAR [Trichonephila clavipes]|nr:histone-lysine N-methyltransferase SETMAR [Trichonephila clavipes]
MASEKEHVMHYLLCEFEKEKYWAAAACRNVCLVCVDDTINESTRCRRFRKFRTGGRSFQDKTGCEQPSHFGEGIFQAIRNNPNPTMQELMETFSVHWTIVKRRLVTLGGEKVMYRNVKRRRIVCRPSDPPASKAEHRTKKVLLSVWWDVKGIVHCEVLSFNQTINAEFYCLRLDWV